MQSGGCLDPFVPLIIFFLSLGLFFEIFSFIFPCSILATALRIRIHQGRSVSNSRHTATTLPNAWDLLISSHSLSILLRRHSIVILYNRRFRKPLLPVGHLATPCMTFSSDDRRVQIPATSITVPDC